MSDEWAKRGYWWQNAAGYRVAAARAGNEWRYSVFAPPVLDGEFDARLKARYSQGERVPQRREPLGCYDDPGAARAEAARHEQSNQPAHGGDHANANSRQLEIEV